MNTDEKKLKVLELLEDASIHYWSMREVRKDLKTYHVVTAVVTTDKGNYSASMYFPEGDCDMYEVKKDFRRMVRTLRRRFRGEGAEEDMIERSIAEGVWS